MHLILNFLPINQFLSHQNVVFFWYFCNIFTPIAVDKKFIFQSLDDLPSPFLRLSSSWPHLTFIVLHTNVKKGRIKKKMKKSFYSTKLLTAAGLSKHFFMAVRIIKWDYIKLCNVSMMKLCHLQWNRRWVLLSSSSRMMILSKTRQKRKRFFFQVQVYKTEITTWLVTTDNWKSSQ